MVCVCVHMCTYESWDGALKMGTSLFPDWPTEMRKKIELFMWLIFQPLTFLPHLLSIIQTWGMCFLFRRPALVSFTNLPNQRPATCNQLCWYKASVQGFTEDRTGQGRIGFGFVSSKMGPLPLPPASFSLKWCLDFGSRISCKFKGS